MRFTSYVTEILIIVNAIKSSGVKKNGGVITSKSMTGIHHIYEMTGYIYEMTGSHHTEMTIFLTKRAEITIFLTGIWKPLSCLNKIHGEQRLVKQNPRRYY